MAAAFFDSDSCLGFKPTISERPDIASTQPTLEDKHSNPLSAGIQPPEVVKDERETENVLLKTSDPNVFVQDNKGTEDYESLSELLGGQGKEWKNLEMGLCGNQEVRNFETGLSGNQELMNSDTGSFENLELKNSEMGLTGNQVLGGAKEVQKPAVVLGRNKGLATSCVTFDENVSEFWLKNKEQGCLDESKMESNADDSTHVSNIPNLQCKREFIVEEFDDSSWVFDGKLGTRRIPDSNGKGSVCEGMHKMEETTRCALKIEVIDETAVIETSPVCEVGNGTGKEKGFMAFAKHAEGIVNKNATKQETDGKKEKRPRRKGKGARKLLGTDGKENIMNHTAEVQNGFRKKGGEAGRTYSRKEMEALRFVNLEAQQKKWVEVYCGLAPDVARDYDGLVDCNSQKHIHIDFDPRQQLRKKDKKIPVVLGEDFSSQIMDDEINNINPLDSACDLSVGVDGECSEEDDSDEDYCSIQRPAFFVTGEPNFESGPPQDGLEYLRRVRWEAARVPKVKVAKLERSKLKKEQTAYMPIIPDIEKCPEHLLPLKQWEDVFITDFSELRLALSRLEDFSAETSVDLPLSSSIHREESSNQLPETVIADNYDKLTTGGDESSEAFDCSTPENPSNPQSFPFANRNNASPSIDGPTLSAVLGMDSVARLSMLRKRMRLVEEGSTLSRNDCSWLFALCTAIDTPLDADTCAALRCLLRKCSSLRAGKSELDDEVVMLNVLTTITGKYFGQSEF